MSAPGIIEQNSSQCLARRLLLPLNVVLVRTLSPLPSVLLASALLALAAPAIAQPARRAAVRFDGAGEQAMIAKINEMRAAANLEPLQRHPGLDEAARAHSRDMAGHQELVHVSERTGTPAARVREAGVVASRIGENIAKHATTAGAFEAILGSDAHRGQLMEASFTHIGLAALPSAGGVYVTQVMATIAPPAELPPPAVEEAEVPAPSVESVEPEAQPAGQPEPAEETPRVEEAQGDELDAPPELAAAVPPPPSEPAPRLRVPAGHRNVAGYWVHRSGRWWYFPVPRNARPGMLIDPDPTVHGPPPGVEQTTPQAIPGRTQVRVQRRVSRPRPGVVSPRRGGQIYWY